MKAQIELLKKKVYDKLGKEKADRLVSEQNISDALFIKYMNHLIQ